MSLARNNLKRFSHFTQWHIGQCERGDPSLHLSTPIRACFNSLPVALHPMIRFTISVMESIDFHNFESDCTYRTIAVPCVLHRFCFSVYPFQVNPLNRGTVQWYLSQRQERELGFWVIRLYFNSFIYFNKVTFGINVVPLSGNVMAFLVFDGCLLQCPKCFFSLKVKHDDLSRHHISFALHKSYFENDLFLFLLFTHR